MLRSRRGRRGAARRGHIVIFTGGPRPEIRDADKPGRVLSISDLPRQLGQRSAEALRKLTEHFHRTGRELPDWVAAIGAGPGPQKPPPRASSPEDSVSSDVEADRAFVLDGASDCDDGMWADAHLNSGSSWT
jgi:hypothetical protein